MFWDYSPAEETEAERGLRFNNQCGNNDKLKVVLNKKIKYKKKPFRMVWRI